MLKATTKSCLAEGYRKPSTECNKSVWQTLHVGCDDWQKRWTTCFQYLLSTIQRSFNKCRVQNERLSSLAAWTSFQYDAIILTFHLKCKRCCWLIVDFLFYWSRERHLHRVESLVSVFYDVWGWKPLTEPLLRKSFPGSLWGWMLSIGKHRSDSGM